MLYETWVRYLTVTELRIFEILVYLKFTQNIKFINESGIIENSMKYLSSVYFVFKHPVFNATMGKWGPVPVVASSVGHRDQSTIQRSIHAFLRVSRCGVPHKSRNISVIMSCVV